MTPPYPKVHVIINPASGPNRPILNTLNDVFRKHGVDWDVSITKRYGDATQQARDAIARGVDLVVGYGGDGTQHELANAVIGTGMPMGILPGGTGNGFAREIGIPKELDEAVELLCTSQHVPPGGRGARGQRVLHPAPVRRHPPGEPDQPRPEGTLWTPRLRDHAAQAGSRGDRVRVSADHRRPHASISAGSSATSSTPARPAPGFRLMLTSAPATASWMSLS